MKTLTRSSILFVALLLTLPALADPPATKAPAAVAAPATKVAAPAPVATPTAAPAAPKAAAAPTAAPTAPVAPVVAEVSWWKVLLSHALELVFALLGLLLSGLVTVLMKKYGFESQSAKISDLLTKAVGYAEQKALAASKLQDGKSTSGAEKMELAVQFAEKLAKDYGLAGKGKNWWEMKLESWLGVQKNGSATPVPAPKTEG